MNISTISARLAGLPTGQVRYFDVIGSTNDEALSWAAAGATDGCLVVADQQIRGRGRLGRRWFTAPGAGLAFSLVLLPDPTEQAKIGSFSALGALAVCQAIETMAGVSAQIKWPNDILLQRKKTAGILVEANWLGEEMQSLVIGIGVNITAEAVPPPGELLFPATSVEEVAGKQVDRLDFLRAILQGIYDWRAVLNEDAFQSAWEERIAFKGEWVRIENAANPASGESLTGQIIGLDDSGGLVLRTSSGKNIRAAVGDLTLRLIH